MVAKQSLPTQTISTQLAKDKPGKITKEFEKIVELKMTVHEKITEKDIKPENLKKILLSTYEKQPENFEQLLELQGVGPKTIRALALIS